ncbi:BON domain-containing protein, partial [Klebsiella pneumoniae]|uniref:BON domain-containing protein n=1 Tax=Klebsiella pneumoniae TaxID=573 RepID=UPI0021D07BC6
AEALASAPELAVYRLGVRADDGKLELTGRLPNQHLRSKAEQIAKKVAPTQTVENKIIAVEVPTDPVLVASEVKRVTSTFNRINGIAISSRYSDGKVIVEGKVSQIADGQKITQAFKQIPGVKTVTNTVQVQPQAIATRIYFQSGLIELKATDKDKIMEIKAYLNRYPETSLRIVG